MPKLQPHPRFEKLLGATRYLVAREKPWCGVVFRSVAPRYASSHDLLSGYGARKHGGRWNPPGSFPAIYAGLTPETAVAEALAQFRYFGISDAEAMPRVIVPLAAELENVLDLREASLRRRIRVSGEQMRKERWREMQDRGAEALTQALGRAAHESGFEGLLVPSAAVAGGVNLVVFPLRLSKGSLRRLEGEALAKPS